MHNFLIMKRYTQKIILFSSILVLSTLWVCLHCRCHILFPLLLLLLLKSFRNDPGHPLRLPPSTAEVMDSGGWTLREMRIPPLGGSLPPPRTDCVTCPRDNLLVLVAIVYSASDSGLGATGRGRCGDQDAPGGGVPAEGGGCGVSGCLGSLCGLPRGAVRPAAPPHCEQGQTSRLGDNLKIISAPR